MANTIKETRSHPICFYCKNYIVSDDKKTFRCSAFKKGIPNEILSSKSDHTEPLSKQGNDIVFDAL